MEFIKENKVKLLLYSLVGMTGSFFYNKITEYLNSKKHLNKDCRNKNSNKEEGEVESNENNIDLNNEETLLREQLKRNYEFFNETSMEKIKNAFVCVVGIGGVGSHSVMTLIRSGVQRIRVIDYDIVTLSSLNRHAFALRKDVGKLKTKVVKEYASKVFPLTHIDDIDDAITPETPEKYLKGVDYVIDCIDDLDNKCFLLKYCQDNNIKVISSMGAGARIDPFLVRMTDFYEIKGDKVAKRLRYAYKKKFNELIPNIKCVFSIEVPKRGLSELEEHQKENKEAYYVNENERLRSLPVFASIPAIFGQSLAAVCLSDLSGENELENYNEKKEEISKKESYVGEQPITKLMQELRLEVNNDELFNALDLEDFIEIAKKSNYKSFVSGRSTKLKYTVWNFQREFGKNNIILITKSEHFHHIKAKTKEEFEKLYSGEIIKQVEGLMSGEIKHQDVKFKENTIIPVHSKKDKTNNKNNSGDKDDDKNNNKLTKDD